MTSAETLFRLQEVELRLAQTLKRLREITEQLANDQMIREAEQQIAAAQQSLRPLQTRVRDLELEIQSNAIKSQQTNDTLYSGRVRNPKEMQDMQHEIQALQKRNQDLENTLLDVMLNVEEAEQTLSKHKAHLQEVQSQREHDNADLIHERDRLEGEKQELQQKRDQVLKTVDAESLAIYNNLKPRKHNQPVAFLVDRSCSFCQVEQEMSVVSEVRRGHKLTTCSSCGRILAYKSG